MREIKFRAWDKKEKRYWSQEEMDSIGGYYYTFGTSDNDGEFCLQQFTGIFDVNGKEIYEGDIVYLLNGSEGNILAEVKWHEFGWRFKKVSADSWHLFQWKDDEESIEIIGNIYENPELLKETKC